MKDEIKEIFRRMNDLIEHQFDKEYHTECDLFEDIQQLLDYLTNSQKENKEQEELISRLYSIIDDDEENFKLLDKENNRLNNIINELEKYLEDRKTHYCIGCSNIYEDSLGKTRLVNEDIFNEVTKIKDKLKELKEND